MLVTIVRIIFGFAAACLVAAIVQVLFAMGDADLSAGPRAIAADLASHSELILLAATQTAVFAAPFAFLAAAIAAWQPIRSLRYFVLAGVAIAYAGLLAQYAGEGGEGGRTILNAYALGAYGAAGVAAGLVYWIFAGWTAVPAKHAAKGSSKK